MAAAIYPKWKEAVLQNASDSTLDGTVKVVAVTAAYVYDAAHDFLDDIAGGTRVETFPALASKTYVNGAFDAADIDTTGTVAAGSTITAYIVFIDTGVEATSRLVAYLDNLTGLPVLTNGSSIRLTWNASGIFTI